MTRVIVGTPCFCSPAGTPEEQREHIPTCLFGPTPPPAEDPDPRRVPVGQRPVFGLHFDPEARVAFLHPSEPEELDA